MALGPEFIESFLFQQDKKHNDERMRDLDKMAIQAIRDQVHFTAAAQDRNRKLSADEMLRQIAQSKDALRLLELTAEQAAREAVRLNSYAREQDRAKAQIKALDREYSPAWPFDTPEKTAATAAPKQAKPAPTTNRKLLLL